MNQVEEIDFSEKSFRYKLLGKIVEVTSQTYYWKIIAYLPGASLHNIIEIPTVVSSGISKTLKEAQEEALTSATAFKEKMTTWWVKVSEQPEVAK